MEDEQKRAQAEAYWTANKRILAGLLSVWFIVSYGFGIIGADWLNRFTVPGTSFPVGFWFAQQGAIYVFVCLIFAYVLMMRRLDESFDVDEQ